MALYDKLGDVYDLVYAETTKKVPFLAKLLKKYKTDSVLELASGTGLFLHPLIKEGFDGEGVEISRGMIDASMRRDPSMNITQGDIITYRAPKQYDAVLALSSILVLLQNYENIAGCLKSTNKNLKTGGVFVIELPNHNVEISTMADTQELYRAEDDSTIVVIKSRKVENFWREYWYIFRGDDENTAPEEVLCDELLYDPGKIRELVSQAGFSIEETYGDLFGTAFDRNSSWREVLVCKKIGECE